MILDFTEARDDASSGAVEVEGQGSVAATSRAKKVVTETPVWMIEQNNAAQNGQNPTRAPMLASRRRSAGWPSPDQKQAPATSIQPRSAKPAMPAFLQQFQPFQDDAFDPAAAGLSDDEELSRSPTLQGNLQPPAQAVPLTMFKPATVATFGAERRRKGSQRNVSTRVRRLFSRRRKQGSYDLQP